jgi:predicted transcriptional regulator
MSRSKLEEYLDILEVLVPQSFKFKEISHKADIEGKTLKRHLDFLISHGLVDRASIERERNAYAITDMGLAVLRTLQANEYLEKIYQSILRSHMYEERIHVYS